MIEKEIEIENIDRTEILSKLKKIKAKLIFKGKQVNRVFDYKDNRLWNSNPKSCIRVRSEGKNTIITFWSKLESNSFVKQRGHTEFESNDFAKTIEFLKNLGMTQIFSTKSKNIERYEKEGIIFELNIYPKKTDFEIEAKSKAKIEKGLALMGLSFKNVKKDYFYK
jgi:adenylate cyclase class IV